MISLSIPEAAENLFPIIQEILRRAPDSTVVPLFVDVSNQRVIIGGSSASATPAVMELAQGNFKIVSGGKGVILPNSGATNFYLLNITEVTNDDGTIQPVLTLTKQ